MKPAATLATFADFRIVKTRKLAQFVFELPIEKADEALAALGGLPRSDGERWVGIALVLTGPDREHASPSPPEAEAQGQDKPGKPKRRFSELPRSQQAGLLCNDPRFMQWIGAGDSNHAADKVRSRCKIDSRSDLDNYQAFPVAAAKWDRLVIAYRAETGQTAEER